VSEGISLPAVHDAAHLVMLWDLGLHSALEVPLPATSGCYAKLLRSFRVATSAPVSRAVVEEDAIVLLAGIVATQNIHPLRRATEHGTHDVTEANARLGQVERDGIVRRAWATYLRHRVRSMLLTTTNMERVLAVAELLDQASYRSAIAYIKGERPADVPPVDDQSHSAEVTESEPGAEIVSEHEDADANREDIDAPPAPQQLPRLISDVMDLTVRAENCLRNANILTLEQLAQLSDRDLARLKNVGTKTREEIIAAAAEVGITIRRVLWK
jgi:hypothetical protein